MSKLPLKVLIDGYYLSKPRGLGRYVRELLNAIANFPEPDVEVHVLLPRSLPDSFLPWRDKLNCHLVRAAPFPIWEQVQLPSACRRLGIDCLHSGYNTMPVVYRNWPGQVQTVQDLMFLDPAVKPANNFQRVGKYYRALVTRLVQGGNQTLVATTQATAREIAANLGREASVINIAVDLFRATPASPERPVSAPYFLHVGGIQIHKNTIACVEAFLVGAPADHAIVVAGVPAIWKAQNYPGNERVIVPGWIDDSQLAAYYLHAKVCVFPSLSEGYGLPVVEALAYGKPLITSDRDPMRELAGDAALLVDPQDRVQMANAMARLATEVGAQEELIARGRERMKIFGAESIARKNFAIYRMAGSR